MDDHRLPLDGDSRQPKIVMRRPCAKCGSAVGRIEVRGAQDVVRCSCDAYQYCAPRTETGKRDRTVKTVHRALSRWKRTAILLRANARCELCGSAPSDTAALHVGHLISVKRGIERGLTEAEINHEENLCAMCEECNLGVAAEVVPLRFAVALLMARLRRASPGAA